MERRKEGGEREGRRKREKERKKTGSALENTDTSSTCSFPCSISMTTCSTLLALGMMPLCLYIYTKMWVDSGSIIIPYDNIGKSILCKTI
jgi:hypothetical protein